MSSCCNDQRVWERAAVCAAMCDHCSAARTDASGWAIGCTVSGRPLTDHAYGSAACPRGRHPDRAGHVRWLGIRWYGMPYPLRWWRWATRANDREPREYMGSIPQCGCIVAIKQLLRASHR